MYVYKNPYIAGAHHVDKIFPRALLIIQRFSTSRRVVWYDFVPNQNGVELGYGLQFNWLKLTRNLKIGIYHMEASLLMSLHKPCVAESPDFLTELQLN